MDYNYDISLASYRLTPVTKRLDVRLSFLECMGAPLQKARDDFFDNYLTGSNETTWSNVTAYLKYDRVNYQNRIYEAAQDSTGNLPTDRDYWVQVTADFRGATERIKYNCQTIMVEWLLNKWFGTTFRQPAIGSPSDIYIVNNSRDGNTYTSYEDPVVDGVYVNSEGYQLAPLAQAWSFATPNYTFGANFSVHYPIALIPLTTDDKYYQMTSLVNKYKIFGSTVDYISY